MNEKFVKLRALRRSDSDLFYQWISDRNTMIFNSAYRPIPEGEHENWFNSILESKMDNVFFVIEETSTGNAIGSCQLFNIDLLHRKAELQIRIGDASSRSKGMGTEAVNQLIHFGFNHMNLHRIYLNVFATNERALQAYIKSGFEEEGILRDAAFIDGSYTDVIIMAILNKIK